MPIEPEGPSNESHDDSIDLNDESFDQNIEVTSPDSSESDVDDEDPRLEK